MNPLNSQKGMLGSNVLIIGLVVLLGVVGFGWYKFASLNKEYRTTKASLESKISENETKIAQLEFDKTSLSEALYSEQAKNEDFEDQIRRISKTVGVLDKLSKTDPELLKKYSKVYFLNENYIPPRLTSIPSKFIFPETRKEQFLAQAWPFLERLLERADRDGLDLRVLSAYRSFDTQASVKSGYKVVYGAGTANQFSADQGYSEHQLATAVDFTTPSMNGTLDNFETTAEYKWLVEHAHDYGFVLSYPPNNAYYQYEPWHWRFVGVQLAEKLERDEKYFYDLDQRDIDKYLINIFES